MVVNEIGELPSSAKASFKACSRASLQLKAEPQLVSIAHYSIHSLFNQK
jgi:hypothetical protein